MYSEDGRGIIWQMVKAFQSKGGVDNFGDASAAALQTGGAELANNLARVWFATFHKQLKTRT